ncbi:hypothetical protein [Desulfovibrio gilichinskyi]|uniref:Uncharacterized protein n=1 Tax=Desulfovibrio gilichinskyi TaxID=1519643 RepID=A0A1X7C3F1_9BACT|nr:hypothetical protein [Desulfovibrio gilichinskyi]SME89308.1 hypothetical protein SAMN06295933_0270 [Desulfovibrio gilichinskyi]
MSMKEITITKEVRCCDFCESPIENNVGVLSVIASGTSFDGHKNQYVEAKVDICGKCQAKAVKHAER